MDILTNIIVLIISKYIYKIIMLYTLNLHSAVCELSLFWGALCVLGVSGEAEPIEDDISVHVSQEG